MSDYADGDCGLACLAQFAEWVGIYYTNVNHLAKLADKHQTDGRIGFKALTKDEIIRIAALLGIVLVSVRNRSYQWLRDQLDKRVPFMALIKYNSLPDYAKYDKSGSVLGHFINVLLADEDWVIYHDPYWKTKRADETEQKGAFVRIRRAEFEKAWLDAERDGNAAKGGLQWVA